MATPAGPPLNESTFLATEGQGANGPQQRPGLLSRLTATSPNGLTFADKLMAAGTLLKGDTAGAHAYLQNKIANADTLKQRADKKAILTQSLAALKGAIGPNNQVNMQAYLSALPDEGDPSEGLKMMEALRPKYHEYSTTGGGAGLYNELDPSDTRVLSRGVPKAPGPLILKDPDADPSDPSSWIPNQTYLDMIYGKSAAERRGKPLAPRVGAGGGARSHVPAGATPGLPP